MARRRTTVQREIVNRVQDDISWEDAAEHFLEHLKAKGLSYQTIRWHKENLAAVVKKLRELNMTDVPGQISEAMLKQVVISMIDAQLSPTTINHRVRSMKQFYQFLKSEMIVAKNPAENLERKKPKTTIIETFSEEQLKALLDAPDKSRFVGLRDYTIMLVFLDTGVRLTELIEIKLIDVRLSDYEIIITHGKGGKSRRVYISPKTREAIRKYIQVRGEIPGTPYLFVNNENQPIKGRNIQERIAIYGKQVNIEGVRVSPHTFRHTFAKMYIMRGGDPFSLQALLGHSTLDMVKLYVNLWGSDLQKMHRQYSPVNHLMR